MNINKFLFLALLFLITNLSAMENPVAGQNQANIAIRFFRILDQKISSHTSTGEELELLRTELEKLDLDPDGHEDVIAHFSLLIDFFVENLHDITQETFKQINIICRGEIDHHFNLKDKNIYEMSVLSLNLENKFKLYPELSHSFMVFIARAQLLSIIKYCLLPEKTRLKNTRKFFDFIKNELNTLNGLSKLSDHEDVAKKLSDLKRQPTPPFEID